ncbi:GerMN domain-containing protein [Roseofilum sp. BLCC_M154]|uniref:GerMN domain-containing protein n=1 Tax=Roseofilum acuticapitatum BLCC-M154 TaxID=3022444 RepID=A0ABT7AXC9_9CYAN|nr:GerMN domain-containing protein [Roseofilum acuticapitatum]MDJ1171572.1 GerMN domain-containing protein [Roseofilum acuticapitatum BLCC-M154]
MTLNYYQAIAPLGVAIALSLTGCTSTHPTEATAPPITLPELAQIPDAPPVETIAVTTYQLDLFCETFVKKEIKVPEQNALQATIHQLIEEGTTADFAIAGYRLQPSPANNSLTIDFRLSPQSERQFVSLSTCERMALLGSLEQTLTESSQWNIQEVKFTDRGEPIGF